MTRYRPADLDELIELVAWAASDRRPLDLWSGGSKRALGRPPREDAHGVDLSAFTGITEFEPAELVLTARAATPLDEIEAALDGSRQMLAFEPPCWTGLLGTADRRPTLGGVLACNLSGPRRPAAGAARDHFLGFTAINGRGEPFKAGGKVVKNVTGYDLPKLMAGSYGTLALLTEVTVKILPRPETVATLVLADLDPARAVAAMARALGSPHSVSGAARLPDGRTMLRLAGPPPSVAHRFDALAALLRDHAGGAIDRFETEASLALWRDIAELVPLIGDRPDDLVWRLSVTPSEAPAILAAVARDLADVRGLVDWGGGLTWLALPAATAQAGATIVRGAVAAHGGGHATLVRAPDPIRAAVPPFQPLPPALAALTRRVKEGFDPCGIFNPGRLHGDF